MKMKNLLKKFSATATAAALLLGVSACGRNAVMSEGTVDLMRDVKADTITNDVAPSDDFVRQAGAFSLELFKRSFAAQQAKDDSEDKSLMVSPLSVMLVLSMTANGAGGETLAQMEKALGGLDADVGKAGLNLYELNGYMSAYAASLPSDEKAKLSIANSIWLHNGKANAKEDFLKTNAAYYNAGVYSANFDQDTVRDINNWVSQNTDGTIENMLDEISENAVMYLINAIAFDAEWKCVYTKDNIRKGEFNGTLSRQSVDMMHSSEEFYIDDGRATGFIKPYASGYSFAAILPNEDVSIGDYVDSMNWSEFAQAIDGADNYQVQAVLPKFKAEYSAEINDTLKAMGIENAFDPQKADFSKMSENGLYISRVLHKTFINVDERGTRAGAASSVELKETGLVIETKNVVLDRPFVYAIIENETKLPIFIGTVMNVNS